MHTPALIFQDSKKEAEGLLGLQTNDWAANWAQVLGSANWPGCGKLLKVTWGIAEQDMLQCKKLTEASDKHLEGDWIL